MQDLMTILALARRTVMKQPGKHARKQNAHRVTKQHMMELAAELGMDEAMVERLRGKNRKA